MRDQILIAFYQFGPTSPHILARLLHIEHVNALYVECTECVDDGLLVIQNQQDDIFKLTADGYRISEPMALRNPFNATKFQVFKTLCRKTEEMKQLQQRVLHVLQTTETACTSLDIHRAVRKVSSYVPHETQVSDCIMHSSLYSLVVQGDVVQCGPLFVYRPHLHRCLAASRGATSR